MNAKSTVLNTRPFQAFFLASKDLIHLAEPYYEQIELHRNDYNKTGVLRPLSQNVWRLDKSCSIGSFLAQYAGLDAFINCAFNEFKLHPISALPDEFFIGDVVKYKKDLLKKQFESWYVGTRAFMLLPLCSDPMIDPSTVFDIYSKEWKKFEELVQIRHSFNHASAVKVPMELTKTGPKFWAANDDFLENSWPLTKTHKDHRSLNYRATSELNQVIDWVVKNLMTALPDKLNDDFMTNEKMQLLT